MDLVIKKFTTPQNKAILGVFQMPIKILMILMILSQTFSAASEGRAVYAELQTWELGINATLLMASVGALILELGPHVAWLMISTPLLLSPSDYALSSFFYRGSIMAGVVLLGAVGTANVYISVLGYNHYVDSNYQAPKKPDTEAELALHHKDIDTRYSLYIGDSMAIENKYRGLAADKKSAAFIDKSRAKSEVYRFKKFLIENPSSDWGKKELTRNEQKLSVAKAIIKDPLLGLKGNRDAELADKRAEYSRSTRSTLSASSASLANIDSVYTEKLSAFGASQNRRKMGWAYFSILSFCMIGFYYGVKITAFQKAGKYLIAEHYEAPSLRQKLWTGIIAKVHTFFDTKVSSLVGDEVQFGGTSLRVNHTHPTETEQTPQQTPEIIPKQTSKIPTEGSEYQSNKGMNEPEPEQTPEERNKEKVYSITDYPNLKTAMRQWWVRMNKLTPVPPQSEYNLKRYKDGIRDNTQKFRLGQLRSRRDFKINIEGIQLPDGKFDIREY